MQKKLLIFFNFAMALMDFSLLTKSCFFFPWLPFSKLFFKLLVENSDLFLYALRAEKSDNNCYQNTRMINNKNGSNTEKKNMLKWKQYREEKKCKNGAELLIATTIAIANLEEQ